MAAALGFGSSEGDCRALAAAEQKTRTNKTAILFIPLLLVSHVFQEIEEPPQRFQMRRGGRSRRGLVLLYGTSSGEFVFDLENDFNVYTEKKKKEKLEYMHSNPVARGLVRHPEDWAWSSWSNLRQEGARIDIS